MNARRYLPGDDIWLVPKTLGCPAICFKQPRGVVVFGGPSPYVTVLLDGEKHNREIHQDNVIRKQPTPPAEPRPPTPRKPLNLPDNMEEVTLW